MHAWVRASGFRYFSDNDQRPSAFVTLSCKRVLSLEETSMASIRACSESRLQRIMTGVRRLALRITGRAADAEDILQDTFLACFERPSNRSPILNLTHFLKRIALRQSYNVLRRRRAVVSLDSSKRDRLQARERSPSALAIAREERRNIHESLQEIPVNQRRAIELKYLAELGRQEIRDATGWREGQLGSHLFHGLENLRIQMQKKRNRITESPDDNSGQDAR
jgi:RNA polymerase sigma-70 factor, ECF subfamily